VDTGLIARENPDVDPEGAARRQIAHTLNAAYADGLLSQDTLDRRLEQVLRGGLVDPRGLVGDLYVRGARRGMRERLADTLMAGIEGVQNLFSPPPPEQPLLLGLDWSGTERELLVGRRTPIGRSELRPGDRLTVGEQRLQID
jgi:hypothetical protein